VKAKKCDISGEFYESKDAKNQKYSIYKGNKKLDIGPKFYEAMITFFSKLTVPDLTMKLPLEMAIPKVNIPFLGPKKKSKKKLTPKKVTKKQKPIKPKNVKSVKKKLYKEIPGKSNPSNNSYYNIDVVDALVDYFIKQGRTAGTSKIYAYQVLKKTRTNPIPEIIKKIEKEKLDADNKKMKEWNKEETETEKRNCLVCGKWFECPKDSDIMNCEKHSIE